MAESSALLVDEVFPHQPVRQWVLSFPFQLRFLFASRPVITGLLERDAENSYLTTDAVPEDPMNQLLGHSITYRIAVGPPGRAQIVRLKRLLLAPCSHCRPVNPMITLIQQAKYPVSPK